MQVRQVSLSQAKRRFSSILTEVAGGQVFQITRRGKPVAELRPFSPPSPKRKLGFGKGVITYVAPDFEAPLEDFREYME